MMIRLGALASPIRKQVRGLSRKDADRLQAHADAISTLRIVGLITWREGDRAYRRLVKMIETKATRKTSQ
jgi:hypothetical protein